MSLAQRLPPSPRRLIFFDTLGRRRSGGGERGAQAAPGRDVGAVYAMRRWILFRTALCCAPSPHVEEDKEKTADGRDDLAK
ncbi:hypothetical protein CMUS01_06156 [Colletotrichum musicola]|uniref:Uncharacterized protein n=1 Tax=Colletotrichum musicola TaxID=2175873 RepID=A0A8H6KMT6_9PEZI|nr:hypothetical protein CMUS01_06156 [Colletotrichum musicola]